MLIGITFGPMIGAHTFSPPPHKSGKHKNLPVNALRTTMRVEINPPTTVVHFAPVCRESNSHGRVSSVNTVTKVRKPKELKLRYRQMVEDAKKAC